jgi:hypothetical protein
MHLRTIKLAAASLLTGVPMLSAGPAIAATHAWGQAIEVPGLAALNTGGFAELNSVSCASAGNCAIGGYYSRGTSVETARPFVAAQTGGVLRLAREVPGIAALNTGGRRQG